RCALCFETGPCGTREHSVPDHLRAGDDTQPIEDRREVARAPFALERQTDREHAVLDHRIERRELRGDTSGLEHLPAYCHLGGGVDEVMKAGSKDLTGAVAVSEGDAEHGRTNLPNRAVRGHHLAENALTPRRLDLIEIRRAMNGVVPLDTL